MLVECLLLKYEFDGYEICGDKGRCRLCSSMYACVCVCECEYIGYDFSKDKHDRLMYVYVLHVRIHIANIFYFFALTIKYTCIV